MHTNITSILCKVHIIHEMQSWDSDQHGKLKELFYLSLATNSFTRYQSSLYIKTLGRYDILLKEDLTEERMVLWLIASKHRNGLKFQHSGLRSQPFKCMGKYIIS